MPVLISYLGHAPWPEPATLSEQLRQARLKQGLTMAQAADRIGVDEGTVWWWERGRRPRQAALKRRLQAFMLAAKVEETGADPDQRADQPPSFDMGSAIRRRRAELGVTQEAAAVMLGVNTWTVLGWEKGARAPMDRHFPGLIRFLGREPWHEPATLAERLRAERLRRGLSQEQAAAVMQVNRDSIADWEKGRPPRHLLSRAKIDAFLLGAPRPWRSGRSLAGSKRRARAPARRRDARADRDVEG